MSDLCLGEAGAYSSRRLSSLQTDGQLVDGPFKIAHIHRHGLALCNTAVLAKQDDRESPRTQGLARIAARLRVGIDEYDHVACNERTGPVCEQVDLPREVRVQGAVGKDDHGTRDKSQVLKLDPCGVEHARRVFVPAVDNGVGGIQRVGVIGTLR